MNISLAKRRYTDEEKRQLIANLDIEVAHRTRQFEAWLADRLENFTIHQEGQVLRIPKQVRGMTMRAFGQKYEGNVQLALRGFQKERLAAAGADATLGEIDKSMRKRKWVESQEIDADTDSQRLPKNARKQSASPKKVAGSSTGPGTAQRSRMMAALAKTPGTSRTMGRIPASPSPQKSRPPFNNTTSTYNPRPHAPARPTSPSKSHNPFASTTGTNANTAQTTSRVPSSSSFNPTLPAKTPIFPGLRDKDPTTGNTTMMRLPRKDENMLSVNGSPLANPYEFGLGWFKGVEMAQMEADEETTGNEEDDSQGQRGRQADRTLKRMKSNIIIRRDPSVALASGMHSRTESQASFYTASSSNQASSSHSREMSQSLEVPQAQHTHALGPAAALQAFKFPAGQQAMHGMNGGMNDATPKPNRHQRTFSALVAIPTKDGHLLEFDPLQTSPGTLDALEGISDSAKKQAKVEMGRLIQATVDKWRIL